MERQVKQQLVCMKSNFFYLHTPAQFMLQLCSSSFEGLARLSATVMLSEKITQQLQEPGAVGWPAQHSMVCSGGSSMTAAVQGVHQNVVIGGCCIALGSSRMWGLGRSGGGTAAAAAAGPGSRDQPAAIARRLQGLRRRGLSCDVTEFFALW
jgi:hypothetical protein